MEDYTFCFRCGSKLGEFKENLKKCPKCDLSVYNNPKVCNGVILENDSGQMLFVKRKYGPQKGFLDFPGGFVESGESMEESTKRELEEEIDLKELELKYFASYPDKYEYEGVEYEVLIVVFTGKINGTPKANDDVEEIVFLDRDKINFEELAFEWVKSAVSDYVKSAK
jgi:ADP-ribose pyrophosphatase YjhB (NUDIX family)